MSPTLRILAALIVWWFAFPTASRIGETWQLQTHPHEGVTVTLPGQQPFQGALSREWGGTWLVTNDAGQVLHFDLDHAVVTGRNVVLSETAGETMPLRSVLPVFVLTLLVGGAASSSRGSVFSA